MNDEHPPDKIIPNDARRVSVQVDASNGNIRDNLKDIIDLYLYETKGYDERLSPVSRAAPTEDIQHYVSENNFMSCWRIHIPPTDTTCGALAGDRLYILIDADERSGDVKAWLWPRIGNEAKTDEQRNRWGTKEQREEAGLRFMENVIQYLTTEYQSLYCAMIDAPPDTAKNQLKPILENMGAIKPKRFMKTDAGEPFDAALHDDAGNVTGSGPGRMKSKIVWEGTFHRGPKLKIVLTPGNNGVTLMLYTEEGNDLVKAKEYGEQIVRKLRESIPGERNIDENNTQYIDPWENLPDIEDHSDEALIEKIREHLRDWKEKHERSTKTGFPTGTFKQIERKYNGCLPSWKLRKKITLSEL